MLWDRGTGPTEELLLKIIIVLSREVAANTWLMPDEYDRLSGSTVETAIHWRQIEKI
jgi:hypothetical protein